MQRVTGIAEPRARFLPTALLRGAGVGLSLRRNWAALGALAVVTGGLAAWGASTGVCNDLYQAWQGTARHALDAATDVPDGDEGFLRLLEIAAGYSPRTTAASRTCPSTGSGGRS